MQVQLLALPDWLDLFQKPETFSLVAVEFVAPVELHPIITNDITTINIFISNYFLYF